MGQSFHYGTITEAINHYRKDGYVIDFNLEENCITSDSNKFDPADFEIVDWYRYEGISDPGDSAVVYAIESKTGLRGILVTGYGMYADSNVASTLDKIRYRTDPSSPLVKDPSKE